MGIQKMLAVTAIIFLAITPLRVIAQERPIVLTASSSKNAPVADSGYVSIGYWDVDDYDGNGGGSAWRIWPPGIKFDSSNHTASIGTCNTRGHYMATLAINPRTLEQITNLRLLADDDYFTQKSYSYGNCSSQGANARDDYLVGAWDIDGGGGHGSDLSSGTRFMSLYAEYGVGSSDRRLLDLQLVASNNRAPASKSGYEVVGYWDVDRGGSGGTDGSNGHYMMTLLAKWSQ